MDPVPPGLEETRCGSGFGFYLAEKDAFGWAEVLDFLARAVEPSGSGAAWLSIPSACSIAPR